MAKRDDEFIIIEEDDEKPKRRKKHARRPVGWRWLLGNVALPVIAVIAIVAAVITILLVQRNSVPVVPTAPALIPATVVLPSLTPSATPLPTYTPAPGPTTIAEIIDAVDWSPDGRTLAVEGRITMRLYTYDPEPNVLLQPPLVLQGFDGSPVGEAFSPDGRYLAVVSHAYPETFTNDQILDADIHLWDIPGGRWEATMQGHTSYINDISFNPDATRLFSASEDGSIRMWDVVTGAPLANLPNDLAVVRDMAFNARNDLFVIGSTDQPLSSGGGFQHNLNLWFWPYADAIQDFFQPAVYDIPLQRMDFSGDGHLLATSFVDSLDGLTDIWVEEMDFSVEGRGVIARLDTDLALPTTALTMNADGTLLAVSFPLDPSAGSGSLVQIWDVGRQEWIHQLYATSGVIYTLAFSPDGARLATGSDTGRVQIYDVESGIVLVDLQA